MKCAPQIRSIAGLKICFWGTYDTGKPRVRILLAGLRENQWHVIEQHLALWTGLEDKSQIKGGAVVFRLVAKAVVNWCRLWFQHARGPRADIVICAYPGYLDLLILYPLARLRKEKIALDAFIPLYEAVVDDRKLVSREGALARLIGFVEGLSCRLADILIVDTQAHQDYYASEFGVDRGKIVRAFVGYEPDFFLPAITSSPAPEDEVPVVLFYGQFIPLHGVDTILEAARLCSSDHLRWRIIGTGQEAARIREKLRTMPLDNVDWITWVDYASLREEIERATVCLGIFGTSAKAARVIPNKVFQIAACGKPIVTRDSPAIRELFPPDTPGLYLVPPGDPAALHAAVMQAVASSGLVNYGSNITDIITPRQIAMELLEGLERFQIQ